MYTENTYNKDIVCLIAYMCVYVFCPCVYVCVVYEGLCVRLMALEGRSRHHSVHHGEGKLVSASDWLLADSVSSYTRPDVAGVAYSASSYTRPGVTDSTSSYTWPEELLGASDREVFCSW